MTHSFLESSLDSPSGATIKVYSRMPPGRVRAAVHINHGMSEHAARYARFAEALNKAGFSVYAHDHRGHGGTTAPDAPLGVFARRAGFDKVITDTLAVNKLIKQRSDVPVVCFGHSMGSIIALNFALRHPDRVAGLACWNAGVETGALAALSRIILSVEALVKGRTKPSAIANKLTFEAWNREFKPNRTDFDWITSDEDEVDKYVADPLCGFPASIGLWLDVLAGVYFGADDGNLGVLARDLPVHVQGGGADPCSSQGYDMQNLAERLSEADLVDVTLKILPDTRHESLNEVNRDATTQAFIAWLKDRFP